MIDILTVADFLVLVLFADFFEFLFGHGITIYQLNLHMQFQIMLISFTTKLIIPLFMINLNLALVTFMNINLGIAFKIL